ncbi:hypothetical protein ACVCH0_20565 [Burkholderia glumae]|uniref:hypothetical protein n=1 Tax=Burkholderia glumae TaxID=337 RepID=UPI0012F98BDD|nr:hypothetical protein [Burkholderia glumae]MCM2544246.1 hypothetical protein [Burkholderia glumae]
MSSKSCFECVKPPPVERALDRVVMASSGMACLLGHRFANEAALGVCRDDVLSLGGRCAAVDGLHVASRNERARRATGLE